MKNHEVRFKISEEEHLIINRFHRATEGGLKKSYFHRRVYLLGLKQMKLLALKKNPEGFKEALGEPINSS